LHPGLIRSMEGAMNDSTQDRQRCHQPAGAGSAGGGKVA
jgi:hypothetical protein